MAKKTEVTKPTTLTDNQAKALQDAKITALNRAYGGNVTTTLSRGALDQLLNPERNINFECGYPDIITDEDYRERYNRDGLATRVVDMYPEESWQVQPEVFEDKDQEETAFELAWKELETEKRIWSYCERIDKLSGIGTFGILLLGINDGRPLEDPIEGINLKTGEAISENNKHKLLYMKPFDKTAVSIDKREKDVTSPRFGQPTMYSVMIDATGQESETTSGSSKSVTTTSVSITGGIEVHWTRIIHVADNRLVSEVHGVPRMQDVYDRIWDVRKVLSGSGEMFWKGAFPGFAFSINPQMGDVEVDDDAVKDEFRQWSEGLQRYLLLQGMDVTSLAPQVADPNGHINPQLKYIAIAKGVPMRVLTGTEEGRLAGAQDERTWQGRLKKRQNRYLTPFLIRPLIDRLIAIGALPIPVEEYFVEWPDLTSPSDGDVAETAGKFAEALAKYVSGNVEAIVAPAEFLRIFFKLSQEEIDAIMQGALDHITEIEDAEEDEDVMPENVPEPPVEEEDEDLGDE